VPNWSLHGLELGDALFCCLESARAEHVLRNLPVQGNILVAAGRVVGEIIHIDMAVDARTSAEHFRATSTPTRIPSAPPIPIATIAAGLLVSEFMLFVERSRRLRVVRFNRRGTEAQEDGRRSAPYGDVYLVRLMLDDMVAAC
jgi:hypothetical protein